MEYVLVTTAQNALFILSGAVSLWALKTYWQYRRMLASVAYTPGPKTFFPGTTPLARLLPDMPPVNRTSDWSWKLKYNAFKPYGMDVLASFTFWPSARLGFHIGDANIVKEIMTHHSSFPKPVIAYEPLNYFGRNVLSTEGDEWRRHRKVVQTSFNERNNKLVWRTTQELVLELMENVWDAEEAIEGVVKVQDGAELTRTLALMVISATGYGMRFPWKDNGVPPPGHSMTFKKCIHYILKGFIHRLALPDWILDCYQLGRDTKTAYKEFGIYIRDMIDTRLTSPGEHDDLFSNLLRAREAEKESGVTLSDEELAGNIFILLMAGHETTANTLALTLNYLAMYPEVQEKWHQQVIEYTKPGHLPDYADIPKLTYGMAIIQEVLRLVPVAPTIPKQSAFKTHFTTRTTEGGIKNIPVPEGSNLLINVVGLHYNPKYWEDPMEFRPERFLKEHTYNKNAWLAFSAGPRSCIGRRFAEVEMLACLALIIQRYKIEPTMLPNETMEPCRARFMSVERVTFVVQAKSVGLTLRRRY